MYYNKYFIVIMNVLIYNFYSSKCDFDMEEGSQCSDGRGKNGTCVNACQCLSMIQDVKQKSYPQICSFQGNVPIVCCTDCEKVRHINHAIVDKLGGIHFRTGRKAHDVCLEHLANLPYEGCGPTSGLVKLWHEQEQCYKYSHRYGVYAAHIGQDARRGQFPHMALLGYGGSMDTADWLCGGSLISDRFILTAGHCISSAVLGKVRFVAMGILRRTDPPERWHRYHVSRIVPHPDYHAPSKYHDIALLETNKRVTFNLHVYPACLNIDDHFLGVVTATGWGALGHNMELADTLQAVSLQSYYEEVCAVHYPPHRHLLTGFNGTIQMCYGDELGARDTCEGDSGGPLQAKPVLSRCLHTVIGVTSYGRNCGYSGQPGIYTRVRFYVPWIESIVWPD
uniref:SFRICE_009586 n=1 Tax=Spodoptera frugiperda TaxID=7108 RepID=A0A2H1VJG7_SPOFR